MTKVDLKNKFQELVDWMSSLLNTEYVIHNNLCICPSIHDENEDANVWDLLHLDISYKESNSGIVNVPKLGTGFVADFIVNNYTHTPVYDLSIDISLRYNMFTVTYTNLYYYEIEKYISTLSCFLCMNKDIFIVNEYIYEYILQSVRFEYIMNVIEMSNNVELLIKMIDDIYNSYSKDQIYDMIGYFSEGNKCRPEFVAIILNKLNEFGMAVSSENFRL